MRHFASKLMGSAMIVLTLCGCTTANLALEYLNNDAIMRYCTEFSPQARQALRSRISTECRDCGIAVRCPQETWDQVIGDL